VYKNLIADDGFVNQDKVFVTYADTNNDGIPDNPDLFGDIVDAPAQYVYFKSVTGYNRFNDLVAVDNTTVCSLYPTLIAIGNHVNLFTNGQLFYATAEDAFYQLSSGTLVALSNYQMRVGRQNLMFQYRHNSPDYRRIDPSSTNIVNLYLLTSTYSTDYFNWIRDTSNTIAMPSQPTPQELSDSYGATLTNLRSISDTIVFNSAVFKPIFGYKADYALQAKFQVIKNPSISTSDNDIKTSVINAINAYFDISNWDFGETFYFSELSAYLHQALVPSIASIIMVPMDSSATFGSLYQINAEPNEIIVSAATVENVEIITAITASQLNVNLSNINNSVF